MLLWLLQLTIVADVFDNNLNNFDIKVRGGRRDHKEDTEGSRGTLDGYKLETP